jgi:hypothetical protein
MAGDMGKKGKNIKRKKAETRNRPAEKGGEKRVKERKDEPKKWN